MVWQIQEEFTGGIQLVAPHRIFVRQGELRVVGPSRDVTCRFFLFNDLLVCGSKNLAGYYRCKAMFPIDAAFQLEPLNVGFKV